MEETSAWSNVVIANLGWRNLTDAEWALAAQLNVKIMVSSLEAIFFEQDPSGLDYGLPPPGGQWTNNFDLDLRSDYQQRWTDFISSRNLFSHHDQIAFFYMPDEPIWNGVQASELELVANEIKNSFPDIPIGLVEAVGGLDNLQIPANVDWVGFDIYRILDPQTSSIYQNYLEILKAKRTNNQKIIYVIDGHYSQAHSDAGVSQADMAQVANNYYALGAAAPDTAGYLVWNWESFDLFTGSRDLPQNVLDAHQIIGRNVTGKFIPKDDEDHTLNISVTPGGSVTTADMFIDCPGDCSQSYFYGQTVTLFAQADPGMIFTGWDNPNCPGTGSCTITMNFDRSVVATFDQGLEPPNINFTNDPLVPGVTPIKAAHVNELRTGINNIRGQAGLPPAVWTNASLTGAAIRAVHVQELRDRLNEAFNAVGLDQHTFTNPFLFGVAIKAVHIQELRELLKNPV